MINKKLNLYTVEEHSKNLANKDGFKYVFDRDNDMYINCLSDIYSGDSYPSGGDYDDGYYELKSYANKCEWLIAEIDSRIQKMIDDDTVNAYEITKLLHIYDVDSKIMNLSRIRHTEFDAACAYAKYYSSDSYLDVNYLSQPLPETVKRNLEILDKLKDNPQYIANYKNLDPSVYIAAAHVNPETILYMENPCLISQLTVVSANRDLSLIHKMDKPSQYIIDTVRNSGITGLRQVDDNVTSLQWGMGDVSYSDIEDRLVDVNFDILMHIADEIKRNGVNSGDSNNFDMRQCIQSYVHDKCSHRSSLIRAFVDLDATRAVTVCPTIITLIDNPSDELCELAVRKSPLAIGCIPESKVSYSLCVNAMKNGPVLAQSIIPTDIETPDFWTDVFAIENSASIDEKINTVKSILDTSSDGPCEDLEDMMTRFDINCIRQQEVRDVVKSRLIEQLDRLEYTASNIEIIKNEPNSSFDLLVTTMRCEPVATLEAMTPEQQTLDVCLAGLVGDTSIPHNDRLALIDMSISSGAVDMIQHDFKRDIESFLHEQKVLLENDNRTELYVESVASLSLSKPMGSLDVKSPCFE